jgi:hypothetical protein
MGAPSLRVAGGRGRLHARSRTPFGSCMSRPLLIIALFSCLTCACTSRHVFVDSNGVVQVTARHRLSSDDYWTRDLVYVRVANGAPDAVLFAEPSQWAEVKAMLDFGQCLVVVDSPPGNYMQVRTSGLGIDVEGWIWRAAVSRSEPKQCPPGEEHWEDEARVLMRRTPDAAALGRLDETEAGIRGGADSNQLNRRFKAFGVEGGLLVK